MSPNLIRFSVWLIDSKLFNFQCFLKTTWERLVIILKCIFVEYLIVSGNLWFVLLLMATEGTFSFSVTSVVEDVLQQHATRLGDIDLASRKAEEACTIHIFLFVFLFSFAIELGNAGIRRIQSWNWVPYLIFWCTLTLSFLLTINWICWCKRQTEFLHVSPMIIVSLIVWCELQTWTLIFISFGIFYFYLSIDFILEGSKKHVSICRELIQWIIIYFAKLWQYFLL